MNRWMIGMALGAGLLVAGQTELAAQPVIGSYQRPTFQRRPALSPYLNLANRGNTAINYYGIIRPQLEARQALQTLQQEYLQLQTQGQGQGNEAGTIPPTGRRPSFFSYGPYYSTMPTPRQIPGFSPLLLGPGQ